MEITAWPGVLPDQKPPVLHFWFRDQLTGVALRICDSDTAPEAPEPLDHPQCPDVCPICVNLVEIDSASRTRRLRVPFDFQYSVTEYELQDLSRGLPPPV